MGILLVQNIFISFSNKFHVCLGEWADFMVIESGRWWRCFFSKSKTFQVVSLSFTVNYLCNSPFKIQKGLLGMWACWIYQSSWCIIQIIEIQNFTNIMYWGRVWDIWMCWTFQKSCCLMQIQIRIHLSKHLGIGSVLGMWVCWIY